LTAPISLEERSVGGQRVFTARNGGELLGWVVVDSTVHGTARGGLRLVPDLELDEVRDAARAMTFKYGLLGLPQGGAKAGVRGDPEASLETRRARLLEFGRVIAPLLRARRYVPDADMGTRGDDMRWLMTNLGLPVRHREWRDVRSGEHTARTVVGAAEAALAHAGLEWKDARVAVEGFGAVGRSFALYAVERGARVIAISTSRGAVHDALGLDVRDLASRAQQLGSGIVDAVPGAQRWPRAALLALEVELLVPCARRHSVHSGNVASVAARVVCPGANDPLSPEAEQTLVGRESVCVPDFVSNSGGVLGGTMVFAGVAPATITHTLEQGTARFVAELLAESDRSGRSPRELAESLARERGAAVAQAVHRPSLGGRLRELGLDAHRRGWLPPSLVGALSRRYFEQRIPTLADTASDTVS